MRKLRKPYENHKTTSDNWENHTQTKLKIYKIEKTIRQPYEKKQKIETTIWKQLEQILIVINTRGRPSKDKPPSEPNELKEPNKRGRPTVEKLPHVKQPRGRPLIYGRKELYKYRRILISSKTHYVELIKVKRHAKHVCH